MGMDTCLCPICGGKARKEEGIIGNFDNKKSNIFFECEECGHFYTRYIYSSEFNDDINIGYDKNKLVTYLAYNKGNNKQFVFATDQVYTALTEKLATYPNIYLKYVNTKELDCWYPKTFSKKIDKILTYFYQSTEHIGTSIKITIQQLSRILFVDLYGITTIEHKIIHTKRDDNEIENGVKYMLDYLKTEKYISFDRTDNGTYNIQIMPDGLSRIDKFQQYNADNRKIFVAMEFGNKTDSLYNAIKQGIEDAGYISVRIDREEHNKYIPLEILRQIQECRLMVADLSDKNNGVYFEEGYAVGLNKEVIQICRKKQTAKEGSDVDKLPLHFDVAQKNTILFDEESEISDKLRKRILAIINNK